MAALDEAQFHRKAASRKKRELAILAAQEIAYLSHVWGNAVVAVEDLGWITNTMQNGRWNRGELVKWLAHYVSQNGGWVVAVNSSNTSQLCHVCGSKVTHPTHELSVCAEQGAMDRDVNAATNIAARAVPRVVKARATRAKNRKLQPQVPLKTPPARASLKYPGRDRTKSKPTPKGKNRRRVSREVILPVCPARAQAQRLEVMVLADQGARGALGTNVAALKQGNTPTKVGYVALFDTVLSSRTLTFEWYNPRATPAAPRACFVDCTHHRMSLPTCHRPPASASLSCRPPTFTPWRRLVHSFKCPQRGTRPRTLACQPHPTTPLPGAPPQPPHRRTKCTRTPPRHVRQSHAPNRETRIRPPPHLAHSMRRRA